MHRVADFVFFYKTDFVEAYNLLKEQGKLDEKDAFRLKSDVFQVVENFSSCLEKTNDNITIDEKVFYSAEGALKCLIWRCYDYINKITVTDISEIKNLPQPNLYINIPIQQFEEESRDLKNDLSNVRKDGYRAEAMESYKNATLKGIDLKSKIIEDEVKKYLALEANKLNVEQFFNKQFSRLTRQNIALGLLLIIIGIVIEYLINLLPTIVELL